MRPPPAAPLLLTAALLLLLPACRGAGEEPIGQVTPSAAAAIPPDPAAPSAPASPDGTPSAPTSAAGIPSAGPAAPSDDPDPAAARVALEPVAELDAPTATAVRPGDDVLYVAERSGRVRPVAPDGAVGDPLLDLSGSTTTSGERGLLGIAWSPDGDRLFVSSTDLQGTTVLQWHAASGDAVGAEGVEVLRVPQPASNHNGGHIAFAPDGTLWLGLGDGGGADDQFGQGQDPSTLLGTLLRLDVAASSADAPYAIPPDNPFADGGAGAPEVWAYGLRNPWRFAFDAPTGTVWVADVGQNAVEEVDRVPLGEPGLNYGWPRFEGDRPFDGRPADGPVVEPVHTYDHGVGCSITGGVVYRGDAIPALQGAYLFSDFCSGTVWALDVDADGRVGDAVDLGVAVPQAVHLGVDPAGEVVVLSLGGAVARLVPA